MIQTKEGGGRGFTADSKVIFPLRFLSISSSRLTPHICLAWVRSKSFPASFVDSQYIPMGWRFPEGSDNSLLLPCLGRRKKCCEHQQCKRGLNVFLFSPVQVGDKHEYNPFIFIFVCVGGSNIRSKTWT